MSSSLPIVVSVEATATCGPPLHYTSKQTSWQHLDVLGFGTLNFETLNP